MTHHGETLNQTGYLAKKNSANPDTGQRHERRSQILRFSHYQRTKGVETKFSLYNSSVLIETSINASQLQLKLNFLESHDV